MLLGNMKFKLDAMDAMMQTLPQSTVEIMSNVDAEKNALRLDYSPGLFKKNKYLTEKMR